MSRDLGMVAHRVLNSFRSFHFLTAVDAFGNNYSTTATAAVAAAQFEVRVH